MASTGNHWRCAVLANWGLGFELLRSLRARTDVAVVFVVTDWDNHDTDPWKNCVRLYAEQQGIPCYQERELAFESLRALLLEHAIDLLCIHAGKCILPASVFSAPFRGSINFHPSLLPRHRGAAPSYWVLRQGERLTGITSHIVDAGIDTGPLIAQQSVPVYPEDTLTTLIERLKQAMPAVVAATFEQLADSGFVPQPQDEKLASYDPRPSRDELRSIA
jgi:methionyl-tRNA formyltransferase